MVVLLAASAVVVVYLYGYNFVQVLNELLIDRGSAQSLSNLDVYCNDRLITSVQGDGTYAVNFLFGRLYERWIHRK